MPEAPATLRQKYCNAAKTHYGCFGQNKAERNAAAMIEFREQLKAQTEPIPSLDEVEAEGVFNGEGSC